MMESLSISFLQKFGIVDWGYTEELNPRSFHQFESWIGAGHHGSLKYLSDHRKSARESLINVMPECQSSLVFLFGYHDKKLALESFYQSKESNGLKMASYVFGFKGSDYHLIIADHLKAIGEEIKKSYPDLEFRLSLDIQPVLERDLAFRSGLGWVGKNSMLINKENGSFLMIGSLLLNRKLPLISRNVDTDHCGQCTACIDSCPTDAIDGEKRTLIAEKCISTFTIEHFKEVDPPQKMEEGSGEIFGCDICQDVCPWNKRPIRLGLQPQEKSIFLQENKKIIDEFLRADPQEIERNLEEISGRAFAKKFKETPLERTGKRGLLKNIKFWRKLKHDHLDP